MTDSKRYRVYKNGELKADLPTSILGDTPEIFWPSEEPKDLAERQALDLSTLECKDPAKDLLAMLSCPNGRRKNAIWEQYDSMVQLHTIAGPGEPAAIVEVPETERACVLTMEAEPYKCWTDPYSGAAETMALSLRGLWLSGADALGMTNCLNFASPEDPEKFYELKESLRGLADACRALDCPVVSGNVSLYNESLSDRIYPTPLVVTAGLAVEHEKMIRAGRAEAGDLIYLVGPREGSLGATRYQEAKNGRPLGKTVAPDFESEKNFRDAALATARKALAKSGRAVAGGGVAVALANEAIASRCGMKITLSPKTSVEAALFSEGGPRAIYAVAPEKSKDFEEAWKELGCEKIGAAGGENFEWNELFTLPLNDLTAAFAGEN